MKYEHTSEPNLKRNPTTGVYYYKRGAHEVSLRTKDFKEAKLRKRLKEDEINWAGTVSHKYTVTQLAPAYRLERMSNPNLREGTKREMNQLLDTHLLPFFGSKRLVQITPGLWRQYCLSKEGYDLANHRKVMLGFLKWCTDHDYMEGTPDISRIPKHHRRHRRIARPHELLSIFDHAKGSLRLFLALALFNGMRRKEIITLRWADVNLEHQFLQINSDNNKLGRARSIPFNDTVARLLATRERQGPWVFPNAADPRRHADVSGLKTAWYTCLSRAGIEDLTWHDLRATYEKYAHKSLVHTDTQREKFADSTSDVQRRIYVSMDHDDLRGLESVVQVPGLEEVIFNSGKTGDTE